MKIDIEDISEAGLSVDVSATAAELVAIAGKLDFTLSAPVQARLEMSRTGGEVQVSGEIKASLGFVCSRCLKEFEYPVDAAFSLFYTRQRQTEKEKELTKADFDVNLLASNEMDTTEILLGQLTLEAPIQPLCREECKGLCPNCGADLNDGACACADRHKTDSRFAGLKDYKVK
ncbi:MAG: DUF177 domain-containing protein [Deltaproteobacteria bacterium]|nr:DUF177 domain-containing protein [Deltaproteobacteria bacterium]